MSDDDRDRSPTPPVGPPNDLPTMISFAEKQEVSFPHLIAISPSRLHYGVPAHRAYTPVSLPLGTHKLQKLAPNGHAASCPCPWISCISWAHTNSESWRPMGTPLCVPAFGHTHSLRSYAEKACISLEIICPEGMHLCVPAFGHTPPQRVRRLG